MSFEPIPAEPQSTCIIFNPAAGKGRSSRRLKRLRESVGERAEFWPTERARHAAELARRATEAGFAIVAAAGGDGTVHEVANGILQAERPDVCFAVVPLGSANDYAYSLRKDREAAGQTANVRQLVDVGRLRSDTALDEFFVCCAGLGFSGAVTSESRKIRHLQGTALYGLAAVRAMRRRWQHLHLNIGLDEAERKDASVLMLSFLLGRREGGFLMAPNARLDDQLFACVQANELTRCEVLRLLPSLASDGPPNDHPKIRQFDCGRADVESRQPLCIHADGEILAEPADSIHHVDMQLLPARLLVQLGLNHK